MKKIIFLLTCVLLAKSGSAQDQLFKKDNSKLLVKITEVAPDEIKYKLFSNLNGPTYVVSKSEVSLVIYENGQHEVIDTAPAPPSEQRQAVAAAPYPRAASGMSRADSLKYYKYASSLSLNFYNFINSEVSLLYQHDFFKSNFGIVVPVAFGLDKPVLTQSIYYQGNTSSGANLTLNHKNFELGFGLNYYPSLRFPVNYYVGPCFRLLQYDCTQRATFYMPYSPSNPYGTITTVEKNSVLSSYCYSITNGLIFRTKSRLMFNLFGSVGFKSDRLNNTLVNPNTQQEIQALRNSVSLYFWTGFTLGFSF